MTFDEAVNRYVPSRPELALMEPWVSGGTLSNGLVVSHHTDLPKVYGFIWRLHPDYEGPLNEGDFVLYPRYAYEMIAEGSGLGEDGEPQRWELVAISTESIEAVIELDEDYEHPLDLDPQVIRANTQEKRLEEG